jgi:hypothetical protein
MFRSPVLVVRKFSRDTVLIVPLTSAQRTASHHGPHDGISLPR